MSAITFIAILCRSLFLLVLLIIARVIAVQVHRHLPDGALKRALFRRFDIIKRWPDHAH